MARSSFVALIALSLVARCGGSYGASKLAAESYAPRAQVEPAPSTEHYADDPVSPFVDAKQDRLSTFSIDVDTASYAITRRYLVKSGALPPVQAVRAEEFLDSFDYGYAPPSAQSRAPFDVQSRPAREQDARERAREPRGRPVRRRAVQEPRHHAEHRRLRLGRLQGRDDGAARRQGRRQLHVRRRRARGGEGLRRAGRRAPPGRRARRENQVELDPNVVRRYRLIGYENREIADKDFRDDKVDAGEVGAGHSATAFPMPEAAFASSFDEAPESFRFAVGAFAEVLRKSPHAADWKLSCRRDRAWRRRPAPGARGARRPRAHRGAPRCSAPRHRGEQHLRACAQLR